MTTNNTPVIKLFLDFFPTRMLWRIVDDNEKVYGTGVCPEDAVKSARVITNAPIYANSDFKGIIDDAPVIPEIGVEEVPEDTTLYGREEIIEALAELGGFRVRKVVENGFFIGYIMELVEWILPTLFLQKQQSASQKKSTVNY